MFQTLGLQRWMRHHVCSQGSKQSRQMIPFIGCHKCYTETCSLGGNRAEAPRRDAAPRKGPAGVEAFKTCWNAMKGRSLICWECQFSNFESGMEAGGSWIQDRDLIFQGIPALVRDGMGKRRVMLLWHGECAFRRVFVPALCPEMFLPFLLGRSLYLCLLHSRYWDSSKAQDGPETCPILKKKRKAN